MAKNLIGISLKGLTKRQKSSMNKHNAHHTKAHLRAMAVAMRKGKSFAQSHRIAQRKVGK